ncbi:MAG: BTAD domain-containing putative transcriptional regulator [Stackebrandtia sp.]
MEFRVLGPIEVRHGDERLHVGGRRQSAVLAALLSNANSYVSRRQLIDLVWDEPPHSAEANLRSYLARLRKTLAVPGEALGRLDADDHGYRVRVGPGELDYAVFARLADIADRAADAGDHVTAADSFAKAAELWRGEAFSGADVEGGLAAHLTERRDQVRIGELRSRLELGQHEGIMTRLRAAVMAHPANEVLVGLFMLALYRSGRSDAALEQFRRLKEHLNDDLGIEPGTQLSSLHRDIRAGIDSTRKSGPAPVLAQLPASVSTFTGRRRELDAVRAHVTRTRGQAVVPAVALHGVAGVGKTALAVRIARLLEPEFPGGQLFLDLHGSHGDGEPLDSGRALNRLLRALGIAETAIPRDIHERVRLFRGFIAGRRMMLVIDNADDERQVLPLIPGSADCGVIVTSRLPLPGLRLARAFEVGVLDSGDAVALFCKVSGAEPDPAIVDIIEACGRLPLAIRRAARRLRGRPGWSTRQLSNRLTASGGWRIHRFS